VCISEEKRSGSWLKRQTSKIETGLKALAQQALSKVLLSVVQSSSV
jgi:hypothetical protein